jgi:hypothetical protein
MFTPACLKQLATSVHYTVLTYIPLLNLLYRSQLQTLSDLCKVSVLRNYTQLYLRVCQNSLF